MKKFFLPLIVIVAVMVGCSSDDDNVTSLPDPDPEEEMDQDQNTGQAIIRIAEVDATNDEVILTNLGDGTLDIGEYFLCLGPGTYAQVSGLTGESTNLAPNASVSLSYNVNPTADGLGVFTSNDFSTTDPSILIDYVQWGDTNQPRVDQAVTAGRWDDAANFVEDGSPYTFNGSATEFGSDFWEGTEAAGEGVLRILTVNTASDQVTLTNLGGNSIDIGNYFLCLGPGTYVQISAVASGSTMLAPEGTITLDYDMNPSEDGLSIFSTNSFNSSDPEVLLDYVQWGSGNQARVSQAVTAGRWDDTANFVALGSPYNFIGTSEDVGVTFWE